MNTRDLTALRTYEAFADSYDDFNHVYRYERWTGRLLTKAQECGLKGDRLLDVGCGTGLSFITMLGRGWRITACDISPAMLAVARTRARNGAKLLVADMRELPAIGEFDLVWAVNDAMNYLLTPEELGETLGAMAKNLAPAGILLFDLNTLLAYVTFCCGEHRRSFGGRHFVWHGQSEPGEIEPGGIYEARLEVDGRFDHAHRQRHFSPAEVLDAIAGARLRCLAYCGEIDGDLEPALDEARHTKAVYVCSLT